MQKIVEGGDGTEQDRDKDVVLLFKTKVLKDSEGKKKY